jgi:hypothetical protein
MATAHDLTATAAKLATVGKGDEPSWGTSGDGFGRYSIMKFHCDMKAISDALGATIDGSASDTLVIWDIPAGTYISAVFMNCIQAEGSACTVAIGDADNAAGWMAATSINTLGVPVATGVASFGKTISSDTYGALHGKAYGAVNTLKLTFATYADIDYAVFDIYVVCAFMDCAQST